MTEPSRILVTGGTAGIGLATAKRLAEEGHAVVIVGRNAEKASRAITTLGTKQVSFVTGDVGDSAECERIVQVAADRLGGIDALVSCAGGNPRPRLLKDISTVELLPTINSSLAPTILPARAVLPVMSLQGRGAIVCLASDAGKISTPGEVAIGAAMSGIIMFCRAMAQEVKRQGIRVNCVTPSIIEGTDLHDDLMDDDFAGRLFSKAKRLADLGVVQVEEVAELAVWLIGSNSTRITGQTISITGGISTI